MYWQHDKQNGCLVILCTQNAKNAFWRGYGVRSMCVLLFVNFKVVIVNYTKARGVIWKAGCGC